MAIIPELAQQFRGYDGIVVMVTNPVDALTYLFQKASGLPPERVIGAVEVLEPELDEAERAALLHSAGILHPAIASLA